MVIWADRLRISEQVAEKIKTKHPPLTAGWVITAVVRVEGLDFAWDFEPQRGLRALVQVQMDDRSVLVVLYPADDLGINVWRLGSAYFLD